MVSDKDLPPEYHRVAAYVKAYKSQTNGALYIEDLELLLEVCWRYYGIN